MPVFVYSVTYITGLIGNILILVAVTGQKQVGGKLASVLKREKNVKNEMVETHAYRQSDPRAFYLELHSLFMTIMSCI